MNEGTTYVHIHVYDATECADVSAEEHPHTFHFFNFEEVESAVSLRLSIYLPRLLPLFLDLTFVLAEFRRDNILLPVFYTKEMDALMKVPVVVIMPL